VKFKYVNFLQYGFGGALKLPGMKMINKTKTNICVMALALALAAVLITAIAGANDDPARPTSGEKASDPLAPLAFLTGGEWEAKLPAGPDGAQPSILAHFSWANNHRAIRISNSFGVGGKSQAYIDGLYTWHPGKHVIVFWYVDGDGSLYEGTVRPENGVLVHEFQVTDAKGTTSDFTSRATPDGSAAWANEIFTRKDGHLEPMVKVRYEKVK